MRILIADDHEVVRRGIRGVLESHEGYTVCGEATNGSDAVAQTLKLKPDLLILDITMPQLTGFEAARRILQEQPNLPIIILSMHESGHALKMAKDIGIKAYVGKSAAADDLLDAIEAVSQGRTFFRSTEPTD
jgi:DNA-binding NarL/FixJ family response regulator